jgi:DNA-binding response OmpR family regulator
MSTKKKKILVIEDDHMFSEIYTAKLTEAGYDVAHASDGETGLEMIRQSRPDVVLLDLVLPKINGLEVLQHMRADGDELMQQLPVIVVTNLNQDVFIDALGSLDVKEYFLKSDVTFAQVLAKIKAVIG